MVVQTSRRAKYQTQQAICQLRPRFFVVVAVATFLCVCMIHLDEKINLCIRIPNDHLITSNEHVAS